MQIKEAVQITCLTFPKVKREIDDLKICVVKNKTDVPFVTSDNPAILTNRWRLERDRSPAFSFGIGSAGMVALLPLTPRLLFMAYDGDVYTVSRVGGVAEASNRRDINALNRHQFLQCVANVYTHDPSSEEWLLKRFAEVEVARPASRHVVHYAEFDRTEGNYSRYAVVPFDMRGTSSEGLMHSQIIHPDPGAWPSFLRIRGNGSVFSNGAGGSYIRRARAVTFFGSDYKRECP